MTPVLATPRARAVCVARAPLPTAAGTFDAYVFQSRDGRDDHVALVFGEVAGTRSVMTRVHSECMTGEVFGSLRCDCKAQLDAALDEIVRRDAGVLIYLRQEGRGIGLANKIRAYALQAAGADTVDANRLLGLPDDARRYDVVRDVLAFLGVERVSLLTNNPAKLEGLRALGVEVTARIPLVVPAGPLATAYLETKRRRMNHALPAPAR